MQQSNGLKQKSFSNYHTGGNETGWTKRDRMMTDHASDWSVGPRPTDQLDESAPLGTKKTSNNQQNLHNLYTQSIVDSLHACYVRHTTPLLFTTCNIIFTQSTGTTSLHVTEHVETYFSAQSVVRQAPAPSTWLQ